MVYFFFISRIVLRLVQEAPKPIPVLCSDPRWFPHLEKNHNRASESSWLSDATCSTDVTKGSVMALAATGTVGIQSEDNKEVAALPKQTLSSILHQECFDVAVSKGTTSNTESPSSFPSKVVEKNKSLDLDPHPSKTEDKDNQRGTGIGNSFTLTQKDLDFDANSIPSTTTISTTETATTNHENQTVNTEDTQKQKSGNPKSISSNARATLSLSIHGDSEYWEKFRYSKDYQSSLMIETICNEVFNLNPSPRYKNLMRLSQRNKAGPRKKGKVGGGETDEKFSQLLEPSSSKNNNDNGENEIKPASSSSSSSVIPGKQIEKSTKAEMRRRTITTRQSAPLALPSQSSNNNEEESSVSTPSHNNKISHSNSGSKGSKDGGDGDDDDEDVDVDDNPDSDGSNGNKVGKERQGLRELSKSQEGERKQSNFSMTSSVFTTTTTCGEDHDGHVEEVCKECSKRRYGAAQRVLMFQGFGPTFHGYLTKKEADNLLINEGQYLVRQIWGEDGFILSFR